METKVVSALDIVLQASKMRRLARLGVVVTTKNGMTVYSYPIIH